MASAIPILDLALADNPATRSAFLGDLRHAITEVGFLYVLNHGVPDAVVADVTRTLPELFSLSFEAKDDVALENSPHFLGYSAAGTETTAGRADRREQFEFATELEASWVEGKPLYERLRGPNQWPSLPSVRPIVETYIAHLTRLAERFLGLVCEALELSSKARDDLFSFLSDQHRLKLIRYPPVPVEKDVASPAQGVGPHKDSSGWWTFLLQASPADPSGGGLQVVGVEGSKQRWISVPPIQGSFVVNIGQVFEVVTHGVCRASTHQVVMAPGVSERYSVAFFQGVNGALTRAKAVEALEDELAGFERKNVESFWLDGIDEAWGESQLRTKVRSHGDVGRRFYGGFVSSSCRREMRIDCG